MGFPVGNTPIDAAVDTVRRQNRWMLALAAIIALAVIGGIATVGHWRNQSAELIAKGSVRLVHADGSPVAGVFVMVSWTTLRGIAPYKKMIGLGNSDPDGFVAVGALAGEWAIGAEFRIDVDLPGLEQDLVVLGPATVITLPPLGRLVLHLVDDAGRPFVKPLPRQRASVMWRRGGSFRSRTIPYAPDGAADFGLVACGSSFRVLARVQGAMALPEGFTPEPGRRRSVIPSLHEHEYAGPATAGEVRHIQCTIPDATPRLLAVVRDAQGRPANGDLGLGLRYDGASLSAFTVRPDAEGRIEFLLGSAPKQDGELDLWAPGAVGPTHVAAHRNANGDLDAGVVMLQ